MGVCTPSAAAVAAMTAAFVGELHIPNVGMFAIGMASAIVASCCPPAVTGGPLGMDVSAIGGPRPMVQESIAALTTTGGMDCPSLLRASGRASALARVRSFPSLPPTGVSDRAVERARSDLARRSHAAGPDTERRADAMMGCVPHALDSRRSWEEIMQLDRRALAVAIALGLLAAACGGGSAATPTPTAASQASQAAASADTSQSASEAPASQEPGATDNGTVPNISLPPGTATELEAMLPSNVGGVAFAKTSFGGGVLPATIPVDSGELGTFLTANGKTLADVSLAMATPTDPSKAGSFVMAFQVKGVDGTKLATVLAGSGFTLYVKGDVVFYILALGDRSLVDGIVAALP